MSWHFICTHAESLDCKAGILFCKADVSAVPDQIAMAMLSWTLVDRSLDDGSEGAEKLFELGLGGGDWQSVDKNDATILASALNTFHASILGS